MQRRYVTVDVFTDRAFGGNQLAVVLDAGGLSTAQMQAVATAFNYSETTFVLPPRDKAHEFEVRIFTPDKEQLRENVTRSGHRPLAMELAAGLTPRRGIRLWDRLHGYMLRFGLRAADNFCRLKLSRSNHRTTETHEHKITRMLGERPERSRGQNRSIR